MARWRVQLAGLGVGMGTPSGAPPRFAGWVDEAALGSGVPARLLAAVASVESAWEVGALSLAESTPRRRPHAVELRCLQDAEDPPPLKAPCRLIPRPNGSSHRAPPV